MEQNQFFYDTLVLKIGLYQKMKEDDAYSKLIHFQLQVGSQRTPPEIQPAATFFAQSSESEVTTGIWVGTFTYEKVAVYFQKNINTNMPSYKPNHCIGVPWVW